MSLLEKVLQLAPKEWEPANYRNVRYVLKLVNEDSDEFKGVLQYIETKIPDSTAHKVIRVQHPYAYGRYLIKKQCLQQYYHLAEEFADILYLGDINSLHNALEYNCDERRLPESINLYLLPFTLANMRNAKSNDVIIVSKLWSPWNTSDSDLYPQYYVELKRKDIKGKQHGVELKQKKPEEDSVSSLTDMFAKQII